MKPKSNYIRSRGGRVTARLRRISKKIDGQWHYRLDYGYAVSTETWTLDRLENAGVKWLKNKPRDLGKIR